MTPHDACSTSVPSPRLKYPVVMEKYHFEDFMNKVDGILSSHPNTHDTIDDLQSFQSQYNSISQALTEAGELSFGQ